MAPSSRPPSRPRRRGKPARVGPQPRTPAPHTGGRARRWPRPSPRREHVVDDEDALTGVHRVLVDLQRLLSVLQGVGDVIGAPAASPACGPARTPSPRECHRSSQDEAAGLDADDGVHTIGRHSATEVGQAATMVANPSGSASSGVMSLNTTPGLGKSSMSRTRRSSAASTGVLIGVSLGWRTRAANAAFAAAGCESRVSTRSVGAFAWGAGAPRWSRSRPAADRTPSPSSARAARARPTCRLAGTAGGDSSGLCAHGRLAFLQLHG
jgi:hypothetical protein